MSTRCDSPSAGDRPLCVDLDGTLLKVDTLVECFLLFLKTSFWRVWQIPLWLLRGRAYLKMRLAEATALEADTLPVNDDFISFLREEQRRGRKLVLATGADERVARKVAEHFGLFSEVLASNGTVNLTGRRKLARLVERFGEGGFDYACNASADVPIWRAARRALFVNAPSSLSARVQTEKGERRSFGEARNPVRLWWRILRVHQWAKNILIFLPIVAGHKLTDAAVMRQGLLAMASFCLCASSVYIMNDLLDLEADRSHRTKCRRPFAAGDVPASHGLIAAPLLLAGGIACGWFLPPMFLVYLAAYYFVSMLYSSVLKKEALLDVFALASLYTIRMLAGHGATGIRYSSWLLGFSMFLFLSLALLKRYIELHRLRQAGGEAAAGRGYIIGDLALVLCIGTLSGWISALVFSLYIGSEDVRVLYRDPLRLLFICPLLLYWISRIWFLATRDAIDDDPVVFALKDKTSYIVGVLAALFVWLATI